MTNPDRKAKPSQRTAQFAAAGAMVVLLVVIVFVIRSVKPEETPAMPGPFDPETTNAGELRRVTEAVSRIVSAPATQHEAAVQTLESIRAESPGARDLKEACVNTYRGMIRAEATLRQLQGLLMGPDGGTLAPEQVPITARLQGAELDRTAREQIDLVTSSRDRCFALYDAAAHRFGLPAAQRSPRPGAPGQP